MAQERERPGAGTLDDTSTKTQLPHLYKVILHNDDYTTMDFVVSVLETVFLKGPAEAYRIMMLVHTTGAGVCGLYPFEIAETRASAVHELARENGFPLRASVEPE
ncbi:MAG: ATP-dependent Clp protease adaptor ClpS [Acidobacteria bacterium]|nr:MAG: ATP-dependent Clp protease adaptor ClpS [Acidobacteriota bacterium]